MTLHELLNLTTMEHRHLLIAYVLVAVVQLAFLGMTVRQLFGSSAAAGMRDRTSGSAAPFSGPRAR